MGAYALRDTVQHLQVGYIAIIPDAVERVNAGESTLYYTWTPLWQSGVLRPGEEVVWLAVPFARCQTRRTGSANTVVEGIGNIGFDVNTQHVVANSEVRINVVEVMLAFGASERPFLWKAQLPLAMASIMAGINQTLMMSLLMVVVASMIAFGGFAQMVLRGSAGWTWESRQSAAMELSYCR